MARNSSIEWTHHTFNPWWGCTKVSPGCQHCYAEAWAKRVGANVWGSHSPRRFFGDSHWIEPLRWNDEAQRLGRNRRVFCASMADVFEARAELNPSRERLWNLILETPWLDWLLLTKRPQNIERLSPWTADWPSNVWIGTTAENQTWADRRVPVLSAISGGSSISVVRAIARPHRFERMDRQAIARIIPHRLGDCWWREWIARASNASELGT